MRRIIAAACAVPVLFAGLAGPGDASAGPAVPAPAASPPLGDDYFTSAQLTRGLISAADLPPGYTVAGQSAGQQQQFPVFGTDLCGAMPQEIPGPVTTSRRTFRHTDGSVTTVAIAAVGSQRAREIVGLVAGAPATCPSRTSGGWTTTQSRLALPGLGGAAAGVVTRSRSATGAVPRRQAAAAAAGDVSLVVTQDGGNQARFVKIVQAAARKLARISAPLTARELRRGLISAADLPAGHHVVTGPGSFTEYDCSGNPVRFPVPASAAYRAFAAGPGAPTVQVAIGPGGPVPDDLITAVRTRGRDCPTVTDRSGVRHATTYFSPPATDIDNGGVLYRERPAVALAHFCERDLCLVVRVTLTGGIGEEQARRIMATATERFLDLFYQP
ncbi:hypothetical protein [Actinoplanes siamensis]|uniref:hypothetical protein n=1 Tax=Actinoplanes siamensis TaxID=1223317 RepID=UPI0036224211